MSPRKFTIPAAAALLCALGAVAAQARTDVQWSVTVGAPVVAVAPAPVVVPTYPAYRTYPSAPYGHYREPTRWDVDGDGIPNRYDRLYNPVWDRDGDRIPDRYERRYHHPYGDRDNDWRGYR